MKRRFAVSLAAAAMWRVAALALAGVAFGCGSSESDGYSELGDDVEVDGWVDTAHAVTGDGATRFVSDRFGLGWPVDADLPTQPFFYERGFDAGPLTSVVGEHVLSLSRFRGLVSTRVVGADAPVVAATLPLGGLPVGLIVSEGLATVLVVDPVRSDCVAGDCVATQTSRVVLVDLQDPAQPRTLGEQQFEGTLSAARLAGGALHVLTRVIVDCVNCAQGPNADFTWFTFNRTTPNELPPPRVLRVDGGAFFADERLFVLSPGALYANTEPTFRVAQLSEPEPVLSAPVAFASSVGQVLPSGDLLRVTYGGEPLRFETFALGSGTPTSLGQGRLVLPEGSDARRPLIEGNRGVALLDDSARLAVLDLGDPSAPRVTGLLDLDLSEGNVTLAGDRVLAVGHSTLAADAPPEDVIARGPQALVLIDIADPAAPRVLDRISLGALDSVQAGLLELRGERALFSYYDAFPTWLYGAPPERGDCGRSVRRFVGYDISSGRLTPAFAFDGLDTDAQLEARGDEWWAVSSFSVSRYSESAGSAPSARLELTRSVERVRAIADGVVLSVEDLVSNGRTLELASDASPAGAMQTLDVATAVGLPRVGCEERRSWNTPALVHGNELYALRFHLPASGSAPAAATLHVLDALASPAQPSAPRALELEPLASGEDYLGTIQTDRALLIARGRRDAEPLEPSYDPRSLFSIGDTDPTAFEQAPSFTGITSYDGAEGLDPDSTLSYDVVDLSDPAAPEVASRLDIDPALATGGFFRTTRGVTRDTAWGFDTEQLVAGPVVVSGSILAGQHSEPTAGGLYRFYLDRFDLSDPSAPESLPPIEIPGSVLDFDAQTGALITLEMLRLRGVSVVSRRALDALVVDGGRATRVGRLMLDTDEREIVRLAVSKGMVYYATRASRLANGQGAPLAPRDLTIERVVLRDGRFERLPSFDVASAFDGAPAAFEHFSAQADRVLWNGVGQLFVADFGGAEPRLEAHELGLWGCSSLDLRGDTAYCAQGQAGYATITLGAP